MNVVGIIAARMQSTRFPGKPLTPIGGLPMVGHVYYRSRLVQGMDDVWIATCDHEILEYAKSIGASAVMTRNTHERATERISEALPYIEERTGKRVDVAVLVQGDEPMLVPEMLETLVDAMRDGSASVANLISPIEDDAEFQDPRIVKVVRDIRGNVLYFSREPIPSRRLYSGGVPMWRQLGLIAFTREALLEYATLSATALEEIESVDMNRFLEHGRQILTVPTNLQTTPVDTPDDRSIVERLMAGDPLVASYTPREP